MTHRIYSATAELQVASEDGADATVYWLVPSDTQVKRKADGTCIPKVVTCKAYSKTGEGEAVALTGVIKFALLYKTGGTSGEFAYASNIIITADMAGISFRLYIGGKQLDQQTVTVVDDGPTGDAGPMGKRGVLPYPQGEWDAKTVYTATENVAPYVWYEPGKQYYVLNKVGSVSGTPPPDDYISAKNWVPFDYLKAVYAELFMARFGKLASAVFWGDYMFSQWGKNAQGQHSEQYDLFDPEKIGISGAPFTPNIMLDMLKGKALLNDMEASGKVNATSGIFENVTIKSGRIGGLKILGNALTNEGFNNDAYIVMRNDISKIHAAIGVNVSAVSTGLNLLSLLSIEKPGTNKNVALRLNAAGSQRENTAILIDSGWISGFRVKTQRLDQGQIEDGVGFAILGWTNFDPTVYLPENPQVGDQIIIGARNRAITVNGKGKNIFRGGNSVAATSFSGAGRMIMFIYNGEDWSCSPMAT